MYIGCNDCDVDDAKKKMIHYILDIKKVMMVIMEKNNPLYVGYNECNDGGNEKRKNKLYIGCDNDVHAKESKWLYIGYTKSITDNEKKIIHCMLDIMNVIMVIIKKKYIIYWI